MPKGRPSVSGELAISELKFRRLFETAQDGILLINAKTARIEEVNPFLERLLGFSRVELLKKKIWDIGFLNDVLSNKEAFDTLKREKYIRYENLPLETKGGSLVDVEFVSNLYKVGADEIIQCNIRDVSRRVRESAELKERNSEIVRIYQEAPCGYHSFDEHGLVLRMNDTELGWLGYAREEVVGKKIFSEMLTEAGKTFFVQEHLPQILKNGSVVDLEYELVRKDGSTLSVILNARAMRDRTGKFLMSNETVVDVTDRMRAEASLAESEKKYRSIFETSNEAMMLLTSEKFFDCNGATLKMFGCKTREEFLGKHPGQLSPPRQTDGRESRSAAADEIATAFRDGRNFFEWTHRRIDGTNFPAEVLLTPMPFGGETVLQATVRDITDRKNIEEHDLRLGQLKNKFIQVVSHQMRTPLSSVRWILEELLGNKIGSITVPQEEMLRMAHEANKEVISRISDMLMAMDIEGGKLTLEKSAVSIERLAASACKEFAARFGLMKITHRHEVPQDQDTEVLVDPARILDVIRRMYDNAASYSKEGGEVTTKIFRHDGVVRVEVSDKGIGMPRSEQRHVFDKFYRGSNSSAVKPDASGLGLYIAKCIIDAHAGKIGFDSEEGKGTTSWFEVPLP